jgi:DNA-binding NtrC family response regulator
MEPIQTAPLEFEQQEDAMLTTCEALEEARVLVVDDEPDIRQVVADVLEGQGAVAIGAGSGEEALERYESRVFDLVWLDLKMPGMDGLTLLRRIQAIDPFARVVLMTAYGNCDVYINAMASGATAMVNKPFNARQIVSISENALKERE